jgi:hypothetical protein
MKRNGMTTTAALLVAALAWATLPAPAARAESGDSSDGAGIAIGLMVAVVVVYGLVALRSDVERYSMAEKDDAIARAAKFAEESPLVVQALAPPLRAGADIDAAPAIAGAAVGWRLSF